MNEQPGVTTVPYDRFRRVTARRMTASVTTKPQVTLHRYAVLDELETALAEARTSTSSDELGLTPALLALVARALALDPRLNGTVDEQVVSLHERVHLGVAVAVDGALVVPVVTDADRRSVAGLGCELRRLAEAARTTSLRPEEMGGATFTVTSLGALGVELFTPIINPPQLAILGIGAVCDQVVLDGGAPVLRHRIGLSLSFDHAATDGSEAARVLQQICTTLERPPALPWTDDDLADRASHVSVVATAR